MPHRDARELASLRDLPPGDGARGPGTARGARPRFAGPHARLRGMRRRLAERFSLLTIAGGSGPFTLAGELMGTENAAAATIERPDSWSRCWSTAWRSTCAISPP